MARALRLQSDLGTAFQLAVHVVAEFAAVVHRLDGIPLAQRMAIRGIDQRLPVISECA